MDKFQKAVRIIKRLTAEGYKAYFAGGWVRDLLLGHPSDDIDIATDAPPYVVLDLFPRTIRVGVAFGVVIVDIDGQQFEVATFRKDIAYTNGRKPDKVEMSSPEEDAKRRDFTINGMFYDPLNEEIFDYVGGKHDLKLGIVRCIGEPDERFKEDRLRMIRAVRFAHRYGFNLDERTQEGIKENGETLFPAVAIERVWQEFTKMAQYPSFDGALLTMHRLGLLGVIFPTLKDLHLNDLKKRVSHFQQFPRDTSTLLYLLQLFPNYSLEEMIEVVDYLKLSGAEKKLAMYWLELKNAVNKETSLHEWAHLYAHKESELCLEILKITGEDHHPELHIERKKKLQEYVRRIVEKTPLVTAAHLQYEGILPGLLMGKLLKLAEQTAINKHLTETSQVIAQLKESPLWPK